jgi:hypothetical protein
MKLKELLLEETNNLEAKAANKSTLVDAVKTHIITLSKMADDISDLEDKKDKKLYNAKEYDEEFKTLTLEFKPTLTLLLNAYKEHYMEEYIKAYIKENPEVAKVKDIKQKWIDFVTLTVSGSDVDYDLILYSGLRAANNLIGVRKKFFTFIKKNVVKNAKSGLEKN